MKILIILLFFSLFAISETCNQANCLTNVKEDFVMPRATSSVSIKITKVPYSLFRYNIRIVSVSNMYGPGSLNHCLDYSVKWKSGKVFERDVLHDNRYTHYANIKFIGFRPPTVRAENTTSFASRTESWQELPSKVVKLDKVGFASSKTEGALEMTKVVNLKAIGYFKDEC